MAEEAFRYYGRSLAAVAPLDELPATGAVTFTATDAAGPYVIPEDTEIAGSSPSGDLVGFRTLASATIPNGSTTVVVDVEAILPGTQADGVTGTGQLSEYVDYLAGVTFNAPTSGGRDPEPSRTYLDRLAGRLELMTDTPVRPEDFAALARDFGSWRAAAIDGLNFTADTLGNGRTVTVYAIDEAGEALSPVLRAAIKAELEARREAGWNIFVEAPTYTTIAVTFTATAWPGWDPADVNTAAIEQLTDYLSPAKWGLREDTGEEREWINEPVVRWGEVHERLNRVEGLHFVDALTIGVQGGAMGTANVTMTGRAPLPRPGTITGTTNAG